MFNYDNDKIRIPNETYCPSKKIQFNNFQNNLTTTSNNIPNNININNTNININSNSSKSPSIISSTTTNINVNSSTNFNLNIFSQDNSSEEGVTISPIKSIITSASSKPQTIFQPQCKLEKFLPPKTSPFHKTLVLDLDETLIHSYFDCASPRPADLSYDIIIEKKKIHVNSIVRPGAREFLDNVATIFEIVIFTASLSEYANPLLDFIDKNKKCKFRLYREHCCSFNNGFTNSFTKDLKKLDRDMKNLIIIDNNPKSYMLNKENGVPIKTWVEDINDRELYKLIPYLLFLGNEKVKDVRPFLKQVNSGNSLNYDKFDKIILQYNTDNAQIKKEDNNRNTLTNNKNNNNYIEKNYINKENKNINENNNINNNIGNNAGNMKNNFIAKENKIKIKEENNSNNNNIVKSNKNIEFNDSPNINNNLKTIENKKIIAYNNNEKVLNKNEEIIENIEITNSINNTNENINKSNNKLIKINNEKINKGNKTFKTNNNKSNTINESVIKFNKNKNNEKNNKSKEIIKNKSSNDMMNNITININNNKNNIIKENNKEYNNNNKNGTKNSKMANRNIKKNLNSNKSNNNINKENQNSNIIKENNYLTNKKKEIIIRKDNKDINPSISQNINKRNKSVTNKQQYNNNQFNENNNNINKRSDIPYRIKYNNKGIKTDFMKVNYKLNNRYENIFKEEDNLEIEEYNSYENDNINNMNKIQREVKNSNNHNFIYNSTQELTSLNKKDKDKPKLGLSIHTAKSTSNINFYKNYNNSNNKNKKEIDNHLNENDIINKVKKEIKIDIINNLNPTNDLLNEYMKNLNKANSLKSNTNSINKKIQLTEDNYEKTIVNDDIAEEEKNENKEKEKEKDNNIIYGEKELFDDIDTEKDDINGYNIIINNNNDENDNIINSIDNNIDKEENDIINFKEDIDRENKKKYFEADDALEYNKNKEKEIFIQEINENESNTINAKSSVNKSKRKLNKNFFNKSKPYPISNKKNIKLNRNGLFINRYQSGIKNGQVNNNNFLPSSNKILPKEFFNYSTRKQKEIFHNNISSTNYKIFKEKAKTNLYLKYNSNNNIENIELLMSKNKPISKHNSNVFNFKNNPKTNRNKNGINENQKISLFKSNNYINNIKKIGGIKSNNNEIYLLKNNPNEKEKKIIKISNRDNNLLSKNNTGPKIKRPISCVNKKAEKILYNAKNNGNYKAMKFANQGKKIYLKTAKTSINTENINNINNININLNDKLNNSNDISRDKNNYENIINLTNKNYNTNSPYSIVSPSGNIITDIFFVRNIEEKSLKTTKGKIKYNNFYEDSDEKEEKKEEKRLQSAINGKLMVNYSKNILL